MATHVTLTLAKREQFVRGVRRGVAAGGPLGVVSPVDAGGLVVRAIVALVQHEGVELTLPSRSMVHQSHVLLGHYKFPVRREHITVPLARRLPGNNKPLAL